MLEGSFSSKVEVLITSSKCQIMSSINGNRRSPEVGICLFAARVNIVLASDQIVRFITVSTLAFIINPSLIPIKINIMEQKSETSEKLS